MNRLPPEPLTDEERRLAGQLARLGPHGEPSPSLDARILASARAAVAESITQSVPRPHKPRWPLGLGIAASALLAVGIAWQLRPVDEAPQLSEMPDAGLIGNAADSPAVDHAVVDHDPVEQEASVDSRAAAPAPAEAVRQEAPPAAKPLMTPAQARLPATTAVPAPATTIRAMPPPPQAPPLEIAEPRPSDAYAAPPPPPAPVADAPAYAPAPMPAPAAPAAMQEMAPVREESAERARALQAADAERQQQAAQDNALQKAEADTRQRRADKQASEDTTLDSVIIRGSVRKSAPAAFEADVLSIPVSDDTALAPASWLQRIRARQQQGDTDGAIESLRLLRQAHPQQPLPPDLQGLLGE